MSAAPEFGPEPEVAPSLAEVTETFAVASSAVQGSRGAALDEVARALCEVLIACEHDAHAAGEAGVILSASVVRLLVQVLSAYGTPAHMLLASLELASRDTYRRPPEGPRAYVWRVAPDAAAAMKRAMRLQSALWITGPGVTAETHLFGHPVRTDPALAPGAIYLRPDEPPPVTGA